MTASHRYQISKGLRQSEDWELVVQKNGLIPSSNNGSISTIPMVIPTFSLFQRLCTARIAEGRTWGDGPVTYSDSSMCFRALLDLGGSIGIANKVANHILRITLSWAAKFSLRRDDTEMFRQHSLGKHRSSLTYSREAQARPVRCINDLMSSFLFAVENLTLTQTAVDVSELRGLSLVKRLGMSMQAWRDQTVLKASRS